MTTAKLCDRVVPAEDLAQLADASSLQEFCVDPVEELNRMVMDMPKDRFNQADSWSVCVALGVRAEGLGVA